MRAEGNQYQDLFERLAERPRFGKFVSNKAYFHLQFAQLLLEKNTYKLVLHAASKADILVEEDWIVKLAKGDIALSFLRYPDFWDEPFPALERSIRVSLIDYSVVRRQYATLGERPILHRKELCIPPEHPRAEEFAQLTLAAEQEGLFNDTTRIGREEAWRKLLAVKGLSLIGHTLVRVDGTGIRPIDTGTAIHRYRTALRRQQLSLPIQHLLKNELLQTDESFFDYGCGQGDDVDRMQELGYDANGWDPHFFPDNERKPAEVVNLGYVLNVIEDPRERSETLREAFALCRRLLVVAALVGSPKYEASAVRHRDGFITSRGTFQRYFQQDELKELIDEELRSPTLPVAPGIFFVFRDPEAADRYLALRASRVRRALQSPNRHIAIGDLSPEQRQIIEHFWQECLRRGRPLHANELTEATDVRDIYGRPQVAFKMIAEDGSRADELNMASLGRRNDMLVTFALAEFGRRPVFKYLDEPLQRDIQHHFGNFAALRAEARSLLTDLADTDQIAAACIESSQHGLGFAFGQHSLQLHYSLVEQLPPLLRLYVGCAERLCGELEHVDLVKVHMASGKVSFLSYDDFESKPIPSLLERVKVNLWKRRVEYFDYMYEYDPQPLLFKSLFMPQGMDGFDDQEAFDSALARTRLYHVSERGPSWQQLNEDLRHAGYRLEGDAIVSAA